MRYSEFSGQLARRNVGMAAFAYGVRRVVTGLVKLFLIADVLGAGGRWTFGLPVVKTTADAAWFAAACFALEVYFRFSGYADIAIGLGRMLGFRYPENFRRPFTADSLREFWRRWNVTLITWLRDYLRCRRRPGPADPAAFTSTSCSAPAGDCGTPWLVGDRLRRLLRLSPRHRRHRIPRCHSAMASSAAPPLRPRHRHCRMDAAARREPGGGVVLRIRDGGASGAPGSTVGAYLTPMMWLALTLAFIGAGPLVPWIGRWRVSVDAGTTSLLMMLAATGVFIWRPVAIVIQAIRNLELGMKNS